MAPPASEARDAVAIVGMACRFPGARDLGEFWANLRDGVGSILTLTDRDLDEAGTPLALRRHPRFVPAGTLVDGYDRFDAALFGLSLTEAEEIDPQHRVFLECAWQALEAAGCDPEDPPGTIGVYVAAAANGFRCGHGEAADLAGRVSSLLDLRGPSLNVRSACSSSLVAIHLACEGLLGGRCDVALAGGVSIRLPQKSGYLHEEGGITSSDGSCRAFDARAEGTVFGSGAGVVVLKRLPDALAGRDPIAAVILGSAVNNDGAARVGFTAPSIEGQAEVISLAQAVAGVGPEEISYVEAHGTGTPLGDVVELEALTQVFGVRAQGRPSCVLGSVKTNIGHLETASGMAGLIKTALSLQHGLLPPSLHFEAPNPEIDFQRTPFQVNPKLTPWAAASPRRAGVSSFGIGGTNAHLVLEEAPPAPVADRSRPGQLIVLSAATGPALARRSLDLAHHLAGRTDLALADVAWTLQVGRRALEHRRAVVCDGAEEAARILEAGDGGPAMTGIASSGSPEVAFLFPAGDPAASAARPALFAVEHCLASQWMDWGVRPAALLGDGLGALVAACLAGVLTLEEGLALMTPAAEPLLAAISRIDLRPPRIPMLSSLTGTWISAGDATDPRYWERHLLSPAGLDPGIEELLREPGRLLLEIGPGSGRERVISSLAEPGGSDRKASLTALGQLWVEGVEVRWPALHAGEARARVPLPAYPFESHRCGTGFLPVEEAVEEVEAAIPPVPVEQTAMSRELLLREVWREVFGLPEIGVEDNFLDLGGDSILGVLIAGRAQARGLEMSPEQLFLHPTVSQLAAALEIRTAAVEPAVPLATRSAAFTADPAAVERLIRKRSAGR